MKRGRIVILLGVLGLVALLLAGSAGAFPPERPSAQGGAPTLISYQGLLTDPGTGDPVADGDYSITFALYDVESGGSPIWSETRTVPVSGGLFNVLLGSVNPLSASDFSDADRWLEVRVESDDPMTPRQRMASVPYALNADTVDGEEASAFAGAAHSHDGTYWSLTGNSGTTPGTNFLGTTDNKALELKVNNARALRLEPVTDPWAGSTVNLIGGYSGNSVTVGVAGATISGGGAWTWANRVMDHFGTVGGGYDNEAGYDDGDPMNQVGATVGGGKENEARGSYATVAGGFSNYASGSKATIGGGGGNTAVEAYATVGGGDTNSAGGSKATVAGGQYNYANGQSATIGGGRQNGAEGDYATVPGGESNTAQGGYSFASGRRAKANHQGAFVWADSTDADFASTGNNEFIVRASGGIWFGTTSAPDLTDGFINTSTGGYLSNTGVWTDSSDRALKENFTPVDGKQVLERLAGLPITEWNYLAQDPSIRHMGPNAQDFYAAFGLGDDDRHIASLDTNGVALAAIQGLYQMVQEKDAQIANLEARIAALEAGAVNPVEAGFVPGGWPTLTILLTGLGLGWLARRGGRR